MSRIDEIMNQKSEGAREFLAALNPGSPWFPKKGKVIPVQGIDKSIRVQIPGSSIGKAAWDYWAKELTNGAKSHGLQGVTVDFEEPNTWFINWK